MRRLAIRTPQADAEIYLHGAHVTHFQPRGQKPVLFMSGKSWFEPANRSAAACRSVFPGSVRDRTGSLARLTDSRA